jgi:hypothetical protein
MAAYSFLVAFGNITLLEDSMNPQAPQTPAPRKKPYKRPELTTYGEVRVLTQTQSAGSSEGSSGSGVMKPGCDRRLKENVVRVGDHPLGIGLYLFDYKAEFRDGRGVERQFGVMADEVETVMPQAVELDDQGYKRVDFKMLGIRRQQH